jgi:hypothetical protein
MKIDVITTLKVVITHVIHQYISSRLRDCLNAPQPKSQISQKKFAMLRICYQDQLVI